VSRVSVQTFTALTKDKCQVSKNRLGQAVGGIFRIDLKFAKRR
jgi:hypothetical protein